MRLIAAKLNSDNIVRFWKTEKNNFEVGDYAIVENRNDYDLVKIVGIVETTEKYSSFFVNGYPVSKSVVSIIQRLLIRND